MNDINTSITRRRQAATFEAKRGTYLAAGLTVEDFELFRDAHLQTLENFGRASLTSDDPALSAGLVPFEAVAVDTAGSDFHAKAILMQGGLPVFGYDVIYLNDTNDSERIFEGLTAEPFFTTESPYRYGALIAQVEAYIQERDPASEFGATAATCVFEDLVDLVVGEGWRHTVTHRPGRFTLIISRSGRFSRFQHDYGVIVDAFIPKPPSREWEHPIYMYETPQVPMLDQKLSEIEVLQFFTAVLEQASTLDLKLSFALRDNAITIARDGKRIAEAHDWVDGHFNMWMAPELIMALDLLDQCWIQPPTPDNT
jgi:hypothetical protein